jgi:hypothetical protein
MSTADSAAAPKDDDQAKEKKSLWDIIITSTPVIMTILATLLAGMSSGAMTRAMYFRSVAGQQTGEESDQWGYFQAKRIRGTTMETTSVLLLANAEQPLATPEGLVAFADRVKAELDEAVKEAEAIGPGLAAGADAVAALKAARDNAARAAEDVKKLVKSAAYAYFGSDRLPGADKRVADEVKPVLDEKNDQIWPTIGAIQNHKGDAEINETLKKVTQEQLHDAVEAVQSLADAFDKAGGVGRELRNLLETRKKGPSGDGKAPGPVPALAKAAAEAQAAAQKMRLGVQALPNGEGKARLAADALLLRTDRLKADAHAQVNAVQSSILDYDARRYRREADYNMYLGFLREMQARHSARTSSVHLERSMLLFYAMLAAQAGMAIGTFAMAVRKRSVMWALAALAGLGAVGFGGWVILSVH